MNPEEVRQIGPYPVRRFIAQGGMAWVFEVTDPRFGGHDVVRALKLLKPASAAGEDFERFKNEAGLLAGIDEPNLVTIFDFGQDEETDCFYYTMTYVDGPSMSDYLADHGAFEVDKAMDLFIGLLGGLAELHNRNIVHRDIKPANVLLSSVGMRPRLADLGIARVEGAVSHTQTGFAVGTVHYMAPEQARGRTVTAASDVFAMGLTLFEALAGELLYETIDDVDTTNAHEVLGYLVSLGRTGDELRVDFSAGESIPRDLATVIEKACRYRPEDRYANAGEMRQALLDLKAGIAPQRPRRKLAPRNWVAGISALAAIAVLAYFFLPGLVEIGPGAPTKKLAKSLENQLAQLEQLDAGLPRLVAQTQDLSPPPPQQLLIEIDENRSNGSRELNSAKRALSSAPGGDLSQLNRGVLDVAGQFMEGALEDFTSACEILFDQYLKEQSTNETEEISRRVGLLRDSDAAALSGSDEWTSITTKIQTIQAPIDEDLACARAEATFGQIEATAVLSSELAAFEGRFAELQPERADEARALAVKKQKRAQADVVRSPEFRRLFREGGEAFELGDAALARQDYGKARISFADAAGFFRKAAEIPGAWRAQEQVRELEREIEERSGIDLPAGVSMLVATADRRWAASSFLDAGADYSRAFLKLKQLLNAADLRAVVVKERATADEMREAAIKAGAEKSASGSFTRGDEELAAGIEQLGADRIDEAAHHFENAALVFTEARDRAIEALADAREQKRQLEEGLAECEEYSAERARVACAQASAALAPGEAALSNSDAPTALTAFTPALKTLEQAANAQLESLPPQIVRQTPERRAGTSVEVWRNDKRSFSIEAMARKPGDQLDFAWTFDGKRLAVTGPQLANWIPPQSGLLAVAVKDGRGGSSKVSWQVDVINRRPKLSIQPLANGQGQVVVLVGANQRFEAKASDPDGDKLRFAWKLDGKPVGSAEAYEFKGDKVGTHEIAAEATDDAGATTRLTRKITVQKKPVVAAVPTTPKPAAVEERRVDEPKPDQPKRKPVRRVRQF